MTSGPNDPYEPMPAAPPVDDRSMGAAGVRPKSVDMAFNLWIANAALGLLGFIVTLAVGREAMRDTARTTLQDSGTRFTEADLDAAVTAAMVFTGIVALLFVGLYVLFAFKMRAGRNWARITLAVLGTIGLVLGLLGVVQGGQGAVALIVSIVQIALIAGALYFMFVKDSSDYFEAAKRAS
ncbi:hypothetical protein [Actinokineospora sp.]|uniref:hypothetical protein n=1 Tax=Actinokineospora sp. TaxID=1872133 RepID=UPI004037732F